jgi:hypothetical protein
VAAGVQEIANPKEPTAAREQEISGPRYHFQTDPNGWHRYVIREFRLEGYETETPQLGAGVGLGAFSG